MSNTISLDARCDRESDVLYISARRGAAAGGVEDEYGFAWRYAEDGQVLGVTMVDVDDFRTARMPVSAKEISRRLDIPISQAQVVLDRATVK